MVCYSHFLFTTQAWLRILLKQDIHVESSHEINVSMLALHMYSCMCTDKDMGDLYPLAELLNQPQKAAVSTSTRNLLCCVYDGTSQQLLEFHDAPCLCYP